MKRKNKTLEGGDVEKEKITAQDRVWPEIGDS